MMWMNWLKSELIYDDVFFGLAIVEENTYNPDMKQVFDILKTWVNCLHDLVFLQVDRTLDFSHKRAIPPFLLRRWLYGSARRLYGEFSEYRTLDNAYESFHACSDAIFHFHYNDLREQASQILKEELPVYFENVQTCVVRLYAAAAQKF